MPRMRHCAYSEHENWWPGRPRDLPESEFYATVASQRCRKCYNKVTQLKRKERSMARKAGIILPARKRLKSSGGDDDGEGGSSFRSPRGAGSHSAAASAAVAASAAAAALRRPPPASHGHHGVFAPSLPGTVVAGYGADSSAGGGAAAAGLSASQRRIEAAMSAALARAARAPVAGPEFMNHVLVRQHGEPLGAGARFEASKFGGVHWSDAALGTTDLDSLVVEDEKEYRLPGEVVYHGPTTTAVRKALHVKAPLPPGRAVGGPMRRLRHNLAMRASGREPVAVAQLESLRESLVARRRTPLSVALARTLAIQDEIGFAPALRASDLRDPIDAARRGEVSAEVRGSNAARPEIARSGPDDASNIDDVGNSDASGKKKKKGQPLPGHHRMFLASTSAGEDLVSLRTADAVLASASSLQHAWPFRTAAAAAETAGADAETKAEFQRFAPGHIGIEDVRAGLAAGAYRSARAAFDAVRDLVATVAAFNTEGAGMRTLGLSFLAEFENLVRDAVHRAGTGTDPHTTTAAAAAAKDGNGNGKGGDKGKGVVTKAEPSGVNNDKGDNSNPTSAAAAAVTTTDDADGDRSSSSSTQGVPIPCAGCMEPVGSAQAVHCTGPCMRPFHRVCIGASSDASDVTCWAVLCDACVPSAADAIASSNAGDRSDARHTVSYGRVASQVTPPAWAGPSVRRVYHDASRVAVPMIPSGAPRESVLRRRIVEEVLRPTEMEFDPVFGFWKPRDRVRFECKVHNALRAWNAAAKTAE